MDFALPEIGEGVYEAELTAWLVKPGDAVKRGQNLMEVMTDKATMEVPAPFAGTITALRAEPGQKIKVGEVVLTYTAVEQPAAQVAESPAHRGAAAATASTSERPRVAGATSRVPVKAAPSVRQMARKLGVDLASVHGSGPERPHPHRGPGLPRPGAAHEPAAPTARRRRRRTTASPARASSSRGCGARSPSTWSTPSAPSPTTATSMNAT